MKQAGIYYCRSLDTILIGFLVPGKYRDHLVAKVIGHTRKYDWTIAYNTGYRYNDWCQSDFIYIGRYTTFTTLQGYLNLLNNSTTEQIEGYFKCKPVINEYMNSYVVFRDRQWFERHYPKQTQLN